MLDNEGFSSSVDRKSILCCYIIERVFFFAKNVSDAVVVFFSRNIYSTDYMFGSSSFGVAILLTLLA